MEWSGRATTTGGIPSSTVRFKPGGHRHRFSRVPALPMSVTS